MPYEKNENEKFGFHVFDKELNSLWERKITLPYKDGLFLVKDYEVSNNGDVYLLGKIYKDKAKDVRKSQSNFKYHIISYSGDGSKLNEYPIEIKGKFLTDMQIAITNDQDIICGGFYSEDGTYSIKGSYFFKIDGYTRKTTALKYKEFDIDFMTQNFTAKEEKKAKKNESKGVNIELYQYDLDEIILKEDGGAVLIGEQFYIRAVITSTTDGNGFIKDKTNYYYFFNDIIVINISPVGNIEWTEKIPKRQVTANDGGYYSSYTLSVVADKLFFVFNDHPYNLLYKGSGKLHNFNKSKKSLVVLVELDSEGRQTREALFSAKEAEILTRPKVCEQISHNELVLFGQKGKTQRFAKIFFKD